MASQRAVIFFLLLFLAVGDGYERTTVEKQGEFFEVLKKSLTGDFLAGWDGKPFCNYSGIGCDNKGYVVKIDISRWGLSGRFPEDICGYLPELRVLNLGQNHFHGSYFPASITNCSFLEELNMSATYLAGTLPDLTPLRALRSLDLSYNLFSGEFPTSVANLTELRVLNFNENCGFNPWELPEAISGLKKLKTLILSTCKLHGVIPAAIGNMTALVDLELSGNSLEGKIPAELGRLKNLQDLELYYNNLEGEIPEELGNLTNLVDLDLSVNKLVGKIPESICRLPRLQVLQAYNNTLSGEIPAVLANSTTLRILSLYTNFLSGEVPENLGMLSALVALDLSENQFSGKLPPRLCNRGKLMYILLLQNMFSGELPESYGKCQTLIRFRVSNNRLEGMIPETVFGLPHASIIDVSYNRLRGEIPRTIENAKNLSELFVQGNRISGELPGEISRVFNLVKVDASNNLLSGPIPYEIGNLKRLNILLLQGNRLNSSIPESLSWLTSLNYLDLSSNLLTGNIPERLGELLPNPMNFSNNLLSGSIPVAFIKGGVLESFTGNPGLCVLSDYSNSSSTKFALCSSSRDRKKTNMIWVMGFSVGFVIIGIVLFLRRRMSKQREIAKQQDDLEMSSSFFTYDVKSFHRLRFDEREIFEGVTEKNEVGKGGSGTVYKVELSNGEAIAVKKMWRRKGKGGVVIDRELKTEVETLGSIRHKNIVKLYCYFSGLECKYAYSAKATTKCDVYSYGVVLMELITGKKPVEAEFGESKNIVYWVSSKVETKEGAYEVLDKRVSDSFKEYMMKALRIAIRCTYRTPTLRPTMNEVVQHLIEAQPPSQFDCCNKLSHKTKSIDP
nr:receptor-like protein kinase HSL1 [Ipomoea batatas]